MQGMVWWYENVIEVDVFVFHHAKAGVKHAQKTSCHCSPCSQAAMPPSKKLKRESLTRYQVTLQSLARYPSEQSAPTPASIHSNRIALLHNQVGTCPINMVLKNISQLLSHQITSHRRLTSPPSTRHLVHRSAQPPSPHHPLVFSMERRACFYPPQCRYACGILATENTIYTLHLHPVPAVFQPPH